MTRAITGLSHLTLAVADLDRSLKFYRDILGCSVRAVWPDGAYLEAGALWLCLSRDIGMPLAPRPDYSHVAFTVADEDFVTLGDRLKAVCTIWKDNKSEGASVYFLDPDGHKLELHLGTLQSRLDHYRANPQKGVAVIGR
jgi:catechol 2,3-dioxygenase-like lactoylglutathione lyase family enzyme